MNKKFAVNFLFLANQRVLFKQGRQGGERLVRDGIGQDRQARRGRAGNGWVGTGSAGMARIGEERSGGARQA